VPRRRLVVFIVIVKREARWIRRVVVGLGGIVGVGAVRLVVDGRVAWVQFLLFSFSSFVRFEIVKESNRIDLCVCVCVCVCVFM